MCKLRYEQTTQQISLTYMHRGLLQLVSAISCSRLPGTLLHNIYTYIHICIYKDKKGKVIPLQARCGPEGG